MFRIALCGYQYRVQWCADSWRGWQQMLDRSKYTLYCFYVGKNSMVLIFPFSCLTEAVKKIKYMLPIFRHFALSTSMSSFSARTTRWPKITGTICFVRLNFVKVWPIFKLFFTVKISRTFVKNTVTKDPTTPQVCRYTTLWNDSALKATIEDKMPSVITHFKSASSSNKADTLNVWMIWCKICRMRSESYL